jgi:cyclopropane-fatty-acyl-phospholipid synthase
VGGLRVKTVTQTVSWSARHLGTARSVLEQLFGPPENRSFAVRFWDGSFDGPAGSANSTIELHRPGALRRMLLPPTELNLGEAFVREDFDVRGDLVGVASLEGHLNASLRSPFQVVRLVTQLLSLPTNDLPSDAKLERPKPRNTGALHDKSNDATNVRAHYDLGNEFYSLFLDRRMVYSCAYFETGTETLEAAQEAKLDLICKKLRLSAGERLLDIGCGWGGLVIHAAQRYGVRATGITLSEPQAELARARVEALGLSHLVQIEVRDYRDFPPNLQFDKIVSVGMVEHVGRANIAQYFAETAQLLKPGGLFLCHGIVDTRKPPGTIANAIEQRTWRRWSFLEQYVFPGGEVLRPSEMLHAAETAGFEARDLESLREHYAITARHWFNRLEANRDAVTRLVGEKTFRVYRLYLAAVVHTFVSRRNGLNQMLFAKTLADGSARLPLTRADLYRSSHADAKNNRAQTE